MHCARIGGRGHGRHVVLGKLPDRGAAVGANRVLAGLRKMCSWAAERGLITVSPCAGIKPPTAERARDRVLADGELRAVWLACDTLTVQPFRDVIRLLILTGQRRDEVARMRWSEIDLTTATWTLPASRAKNGAAHGVPLSAPALALLAALPRSGEYVFAKPGWSTPVTDFGGAKKRLDAALGPDMAHWTFHDLRRTTATGLARLGIGLPVIEKVLNHTSGSFGGIVGVYQKHGFQDEKRAALDAWSSFVHRLVTEEPGTNVVPLARTG